MRAIDNRANMSNHMLKQRQNECLSELALCSRKNVKLKARILADYITYGEELESRDD